MVVEVFEEPCWIWGAFALRAEDGRTMAIQIADPMTMVIEVEHAPDGTPRYVVSISGEGRPWDIPFRPMAQSVGIIGAPDAGKTQVDSNIHALATHSPRKSVADSCPGSM